MKTLNQILIKHLIILIGYNIIIYVLTFKLKGADTVILRYLISAICIGIHFIYLILQHSKIVNGKIDMNYLLVAFIILLIGFSFCSQIENINDYIR